MAAVHPKVAGVPDIENPNDLLRTGTNEKRDDLQTIEPEVHSAEYNEYLGLVQEFTGDKLTKLNRKIDLHVIPPLMVIYMMTYVDRSNVGNARLFGAQTDLGLSGTDWNIGLMLLFITFAIGSPICTLLAKRFSAKIMLPILFFGCGATIIGAGCTSNKAGWFSLRLVLGLTESGVPGISAYAISTWYSPENYASRCSWFYFGATLSGAVSGLLAYGIGQLDYTWGYRGWRWIYVLEGFASCILAIFTLWWLQDNPEKRVKWATEREQRYIILRNKFAYGTDSSGNSNKFNLNAYLSVFKSPHFLITASTHLCFACGVYAFSFALPTIINNMGYTAAAAQGLSAPPYIAATLAVWFCGWASDRYRKRCLMVIGPSAVAVVGVIMMWTTAGSKSLVAVCYIGCFLAAMGFYPLTPSYYTLYSLNNAGQSKRSAAFGANLIWAQAGGVLGSNIYLQKEAPRYNTGFGVSAGLLVVGNIIVMGIYWWWVGKVNARRAAMDEAEIRAKYTPEELEEMGDNSPFYVYSR